MTRSGCSIRSLDLIAQRVYGLVQGYPDLNDHDQLRFDPMFGLAIGKLESQHARARAASGQKHPEPIGRERNLLKIAASLSRRFPAGNNA